MNAFMQAGPAARTALRLALSQALRTGSPQRSVLQACLVPQAAVEMGLPCHIGDYTDFYTSIHHATSVGKQFRPDNPLLPNYKWVPIGYHGRASSIGVSGASRFAGRPANSKARTMRRPASVRPGGSTTSWSSASSSRSANAQGEPVPIADAEAHLFGLALFNDWTARDIQAWEYQPLGPFLSKNFASTLSPWIVTMEALAPFRAPFARPAGEPAPLPYLDSPANRASGAHRRRARSLAVRRRRCAAPACLPQRLMQSNFRDSYWTLAQLVAHHTVNGCNLQAGDLFGSGTQSGPDPGQGGSLLELSSGGKQPLQLANGERRSFLEDGDTVILRGHCARPGFRRIGFGDCAGTIAPAERLPPKTPPASSPQEGARLGAAQRRAS